MKDMTLVSHHLCPYVQRAAILAAEKGIDLERVMVDLSDKPDWFLKISPTGKVPLLRVGDEVLFESAPIVEYLDEATDGSLHPQDMLVRARHRAWMEFGSATLNDIGGLYNTPDADSFEVKKAALRNRFVQVEKAIRSGSAQAPWFDGGDFHIVDAVWGPVFRYFDVIEPLVPLGIFDDLPKIAIWRAALAARPSVINAVSPDYPARLTQFFLNRDSHLAHLIRQRQMAA